MFDNLKTDEALLKALDRATRVVPTRDEADRQRVSFISSAVKSDANVTQARIKEVLDRLS